MQNQKFAMIIILLLIGRETTAISVQPSSGFLKKKNTKDKRFQQQKPFEMSSKLRLASKFHTKKAKIEPITTSISLSFLIGFFLLNAALDWGLNKKFIIPLYVDAQKNIANTFLESRKIKERFCHNLRQLNSLISPIYNINEFKLVHEYYTAFHNYSENQNLLEETKISDTSFQIKMMTSSRKFMSESEEHYCQMNYDLFGEDKYFVTRLNSKQSQIEKSGSIGSIFFGIVHTISRSFVFFEADDLWSEFIKTAKSIINAKSTINSLLEENNWFMKIKNYYTSSGMIGDEINEKKIQNYIKKSTVLNSKFPCLLNAKTSICTKDTIRIEITKLFKEFYELLKGFKIVSHELEGVEEFMIKMANLRNYLEVTYNLYRFLLLLSKRFSEKYKLDKTFLEESELWENIEKLSLKIAYFRFKIFWLRELPDDTAESENKNEKLINYNQKYMRLVKNFVNNNVLTIFNPIRKLQFKSAFWRVFYEIKSALTFKKLRAMVTPEFLISNGASFLLKYLFELIMGVIAVTIVLKIVMGLYSFGKTIFQTWKMHKENINQNKAEEFFLANTLLPNIDLHLQYTYCNFMIFYFYFIKNQLFSLTLDNVSILKSDSFVDESELDSDEEEIGIGSNIFGSSKPSYKKIPLNTDEVDKKKKYIFRGINLPGTNEPKLMPTTVEDQIKKSMFHYLSDKCQMYSVFCKDLSHILDKFLLEEDHSTLKKKIFYNLNSGPISKVMKIELNETNKFNDKYLLANNFSMHTVNYYFDNPEENINIAFLYCRSCSDYVLVEDHYKEIKFTEAIQNLNEINIDEDVKEKFNRGNLIDKTAKGKINTISSYIQRSVFKKIQLIQIYSFGYKRLENSEENEEIVIDETIEQSELSIRSLFQYSPIKSGEEETQILISNLVFNFGLQSDSYLKVKYNEYNFATNIWAHLPIEKTFIAKKISEYDYNSFLSKEPDNLILNIMIIGKTQDESKVITTEFSEEKQKYSDFELYDSDFVEIISNLKKPKLQNPVEGKKIYRAIPNSLDEIPKLKKECNIRFSKDKTIPLSIDIVCVKENIEKELKSIICERCLFHDEEKFGKLYNDKSMIYSKLVSTMNSLLIWIVDESKPKEKIKNSIYKLYDPIEEKIGLQSKGLHSPKKIPSISEFKEELFGIFEDQKTMLKNYSLVLSFHENNPSKYTKEIKGKKFLDSDQDVKQLKFRIFFPIQVDPSSKLVYRLIKGSDLSSDGSIIANGIYEVIEKKTKNENMISDESEEMTFSESNQNDESELSDEWELSEESKSSEESEEMSESKFSEEKSFLKNYNELSASDKEKLLLVDNSLSKISSVSAIGNFDYKRFSQSPRQWLLYVEYKSFHTENPDLLQSDFYDENSIIQNSIIKEGFIPYWPEFSEADSLQIEEGILGNEIQPSGNYFMIMWMKQSLVFGFRLWVKYYYSLETHTNFICQDQKKNLMNSKIRFLKSKRMILNKKKSFESSKNPKRSEIKPIQRLNNHIHQKNY